MLQSDGIRMHSHVVHGWCSTMIATNWMMSAIITVHWDGLLPAAEGKISMHMRQKTGFFPHVPVQQSTAKKFSRR